jgi:hypothetical protein
MLEVAGAKVSFRAKSLLPWVVLLYVALASRHAVAVGFLAKSSAATPGELRVAVAVGPSRTTLWAQMRVADSQPGPLALIVPAPLGARLDLASDAWLEALEVATAPRVLSPKDVVASCPGSPSSNDRLHIVGELGHDASAHPLELRLLDSADAVAEWGNKNGLTVSSPMRASLAALSPMQFLVVRISSPGGEALTPTVRINAPGGQALLPLLLTKAGDQPLLITSWLLGESRLVTSPGIATAIDEGAIVFDAASGESNYAQVRANALGGAQAQWLESARRDQWWAAHPLAQRSVIDGVIDTYFKRAASYQGGPIDAAACVTAAGMHLAGTARVGVSCPRTAAGVVGSAAPCEEKVSAGEIDPDDLRCTQAIDDLAVALSELSLPKVWLTRASRVIAAGETGAALTVASAPGAEVVPIYTAASVDTTSCNDAKRPATPSSDPGDKPKGKTVNVPVYAVRDSCSSDHTLMYMREVPANQSTPDYYYYRESDCSGDATATYAGYGDAGSGSNSTGGTTGSDPEVDVDGDCDGGSSSSNVANGDQCSGDPEGATSSEDCNADTGSGAGADDWGDCDGGDAAGAGDACDGGDFGGGDSCSGGGGDFDGCSGGGSAGGSGCSGGSGAGDCAIQGHARARRPRLSMVVFFSLLVIAPLRRRARKQRT